MHPERAKQIEEILQQAIDLEGEAQLEFLDRACANDSELRREIEQMLSYKVQTGRILKYSRGGGFPSQVHFDILRTGDRIGHYRIESSIGSGGMGQVYRASDEQLPRQVAIKILPMEFSADEERLRRFELEARTASTLNHPNIITIHEIGRVQTEQGDLHFIVTELVEGQTLRAYLNESSRGEAIPWRKAVEIGIQIAGALQAAHTAGIIHRDIKPENVMIQKDGHVKTLDFGIAKRVGEPWGDGRPGGLQGIETAAGGRPGTVRYMSPEQARGGRLDARSDIFSLGVVLFEMLAGHRPYGQADGEEVIRELKRPAEIDSVRKVNPDLPAALDLIVKRALKKDPAERYSSAGEILNRLQELRINPEKQAMRGLRAQDANQILTQSVVRYDENKATRIPLRALWPIWRFADLERGRLESELIRKSLHAGLRRVGMLLFVVASTAAVLAAALSVTETWDEQVMHDGHTAAVRHAAFSPDGRLLVSVGEDRRIIVWDFHRRQRLATFDRDHTDWVASVAFSPDGRRFATASYDKTVIVWDAINLKKEARLLGHRGAAIAVAFSPDGKTLVSESKGPSDGSVDDGTILWRTGTWERFAQIPVVGTDANPLLFLPGDGRRIYYPHLTHAWDAATGQPLMDQFDPDWNGTNAAFSPDGSLLVSVNSDGEVLFADFKQRRTLSRVKGHQDNGRAAAFSPDGRLIATGAENIALWDAATRRKITTIYYPSIVWSAAFSPDSRWLVTTHGDGSIRAWDTLERQSVVGFNEHDGAVRAVAWSPDGRRFASAGEDRSIMVWDAGSGRREMLLFGHSTRVTGLAFSPDGLSLASADYEGVIIVWDLEGRRERLRFGHPSTKKVPSKCLVYSPDGRLLAASHGVYDVATGKFVADIRLGFDIYGLAFSPDGKRLAGADAFGSVFTFDTATWQLADRSNMSPRQFISVSFSPDGRHVVTGEDEGAVQLWTAQPLRPTVRIGAHGARVKSVAFSPDGRQLVSAGDDKMIALWDVGARRLNTRIGLHTAPVYTVAFSPNGRQLVSGGHDHSVRLYTRQKTLWGWKWD